MTIKTQKIINMHTLRMLSTRQIANILGLKKNSVIHLLRYHKVLRKSLGRDTEELVAKWYERQGITVSRQIGDAPFDLLINNERYDVKSANASGKYAAYHFQIQDHSSRLADKDLSFIDWFLFVFLDVDGQPMYKVRSSDITAKYGITIYNIKTTKLPLQFVGLLEEKGV